MPATEFNLRLSDISWVLSTALTTMAGDSHEFALGHCIYMHCTKRTSFNSLITQGCAVVENGFDNELLKGQFSQNKNSTFSCHFIAVWRSFFCGTQKENCE